jgi:MFS family permease
VDRDAERPDHLALPPGRGARVSRAAFGQLSLLSNPVLRRLAVTSGVNMFGRSAFLTLTVLFATTRAGLTPATTALILTIANAVGLITGATAGHLADRIPTRTMFAVSMTIEGLALWAIPWSTNAVVIGIVATVFVGANRATFAARSATLAYAFTAGDRAAPRAIVKMANNVAVAAGSAAAAIPVLVGTTIAYQVAYAVAGIGPLASVAISRGLPAISAPAPATESAAATANDRRSPFRDKRYLLLTVLAGLFAMQFGVAEVGVPIWVTGHTAAPAVVITVAFAINTVLIVFLQLPLSRGTDQVRHAANASAIAGGFMAGACAIYAAAAGTSPAIAITLLIAAVVTHTIAEILSSAGTTGLGFELAAPSRQGAYLGVFAMGTSIGSMLAPLAVVAAIGYGTVGWLVLGLVFVGVGIGVRMLARLNPG